MSIELRSYLVNWRNDLEAAAERNRQQRVEKDREAEVIDADIADLDRAIAALTPAPYGATREEVAAFKARYSGFQPYEGATLQDAPDSKPFRVYVETANQGGGHYFDTLAEARAFAEKARGNEDVLHVNVRERSSTGESVELLRWSARFSDLTAAVAELSTDPVQTPFGAGWDLGWAGADRPDDAMMLEGYKQGSRQRAEAIAEGKASLLKVPNYDGTGPSPGGVEESRDQSETTESEPVESDVLSKSGLDLANKFTVDGVPIQRSVEIDGEWIDGDDEEGNKRSVEYSQGFEAGRLGGERDPDQSEDWWTGYADGKARRDEVAASEGYAPVVAADEPEPEPSLLDRFNPFRVKADA